MNTDAEGLAKIVAAAIENTMAPLRARIVQLEQTVNDLSARPRGLKYEGVWREDTQYSQGDTVTERGSMWVALKATRMKPGDSPDWQLAVKAGRDAR